MAILMAHQWLGNVRELENVIQRATVIAKADTITAKDLPPELRANVGDGRPQPKDLKEIARESAETIEKPTIADALEKSGGNATQAAKALGISRATLQNRMKLYGIRSHKD